MKIVDDIEARFEWFQEGYDARGKRSFAAIQKCTSAIRQLGYGDGMVVAPSMVGVLGDEMVDKMIDRCNVLIGGLLGDEGDGMDHPAHPKCV
ncbi:hypothetical protein QVD17_36856 [Tagetes erecta]|uniref:Uncharacterized protein n=1 Tax=Tagetes erecta TaxID=13708 RepID=A0AAD8JX42_TARER|nr:hypothetical protein QVD17_36856 [Tagetes erecta]